MFDNWQPQPAGHPIKAPFDGSSLSGKSWGLSRMSRTVFNSGCFAAVYGGIHQPSPNSVIGPFKAECKRPSSIAAFKGSRTAFIQSSPATSGWPFSFIDANVVVVAPTTISTEQPYPASSIILSTLAISVADGQFISAIVISPQSAKAEEPKTVITDAIEIPVSFLSFIITPFL